MNLLGVYEISIENKDTINEEIYIGSTVRSIRRRVEEHKADIEKSKGSIALAQRLLNFDATAKWDQTRVLRVLDDPQKLRVAETLEIFTKKSKENNIINFNNPERVSLAWDYGEFKNRTAHRKRKGSFKK